MSFHVLLRIHPAAHTRRPTLHRYPIRNRNQTPAKLQPSRPHPCGEQRSSRYPTCATVTFLDISTRIRRSLYNTVKFGRVRLGILQYPIHSELFVFFAGAVRVFGPPAQCLQIAWHVPCVQFLHFSAATEAIPWPLPCGSSSPQPSLASPPGGSAGTRRTVTYLLPRGVPSLMFSLRCPIDEPRENRTLPLDTCQVSLSDCLRVLRSLSRADHTGAQLRALYGQRSRAIDRFAWTLPLVPTMIAIAAMQHYTHSRYCKRHLPVWILRVHLVHLPGDLARFYGSHGTAYRHRQGQLERSD
ncbi:hypothetical protein EDB89DRAFT_1502592 [Lactarius sanguifluus]|nr:hypothetical protein EDB89DRAFT_1502592 [Lactarius sanguifluus]